MVSVCDSGVVMIVFSFSVTIAEHNQISCLGANATNAVNGAVIDAYALFQ